MDFEIEKLLFEQVDKPKNYLMTKAIKLWDNRYRINIYVEFEEDKLIKRKIISSYFCHYSTNKLTIIPDIDKNPTDPLKKHA